MTDIPNFFVPASTPETAEADFEGLARMAQRPVPELSERVYSISYRHNGAEWVATIGQTLRGVKIPPARSGGNSFEQNRSLSDPATVLAIFPGAPYIVVTNHRLAGNIGSKWENPFMAGQPSAVQRFAR